MKPLRTGQIPAKANIEEQQKFHDHTLQPLLKQSQASKCHVLFLDGAHFVWQLLWPSSGALNVFSSKLRLAVFASTSSVPSTPPPKNSPPCTIQPRLCNLITFHPGVFS